MEQINETKVHFVGLFSRIYMTMHGSENVNYTFIQPHLFKMRCSVRHWDNLIFKCMEVSDQLNSDQFNPGGINPTHSMDSRMVEALQTACRFRLR